MESMSREKDEAGTSKQESEDAKIDGILREHSEMLKNISEKLSQIQEKNSLK